MPKQTIFIISGPRSSGKTMFLSDIYSFLSLFENDIRGFISYGTFNDDGQKDFILKALGTNAEIHLASRKPAPDYIRAGDFYFNPEAIKEGNDIILSAIADKAPILMIDEIGPLELMEQIWHESFQQVLKQFNGILIFTCRRKMIENVVEKFKITEAFVEEVQKTSPRKSGEAIMSILNLRRKI